MKLRHTKWKMILEAEYDQLMYITDLNHVIKVGHHL